MNVDYIMILGQYIYWSSILHESVIEVLLLALHAYDLCATFFDFFVWYDSTILYGIDDWIPGLYFWNLDAMAL